MRRLLVTALMLAGLAVVPAAFAKTPATGTTTTSAATTPSSTVQGPAFGLRAVGNPKLGYFVYAGKSGSVLTGAVAVTNTGDQTGTVKIYPADATTGSTTGAVYLTDSKPTSVGTWIALDESTATLKPGQRTIVHFSVKVPAGTAAGEYVGGIVAETVQETQSPKSKQKANVQIRVRNLSIVAVEVNTPGALAAQFTITSAEVGGSKGRQQVLIHVANDGNVLSKPTGTVTVETSSGTAVETIPFTMDTFLPHTAIDYPVELKTALPAGNYLASVKLSYAKNGTNAVAGTPVLTASSSPSFSVSKTDVAQVFKSTSPTKTTPGLLGSSSGTSKTLEYAGAAAVIVLLLVIVFLLLRRGKGGRGGDDREDTRPRRPAPTPTPPPSAPGPVETSRAETIAPVAPVASTPAPIAPPPPPPPPPVVEPPPRAAAAPASCVPFHYWDVDWDHGQAGSDGVVRYPHRCRNCGAQVLAKDISEAAALADSQ